MEPRLNTQRHHQCQKCLFFCVNLCSNNCHYQLTCAWTVQLVVVIAKAVAYLHFLMCKINKISKTVKSRTVNSQCEEEISQIL